MFGTAAVFGVAYTPVTALCHLAGIAVTRWAIMLNPADSSRGRST